MKTEAESQAESLTEQLQIAFSPDRNQEARGHVAGWLLAELAIHELRETGAMPIARAKWIEACATAWDSARKHHEACATCRDMARRYDLEVASS